MTQYWRQRTRVIRILIVQNTLTNIACVAGVNEEGKGISWQETRGRREVTAHYRDKEARFQ